MSLPDLLAVQDLDTALDQLRHRRANLPEAAAKASIDAEIAAAASERAARLAERDRLANEEVTLERDDASLTRKVADLEAKLAKTVVPREAETFQHEIQVVRAQRSLLEDRELELLEAIEPIEKRLTELDAALAVLASSATKAQASLDVAQSAVDADIADATARRVGAVAAVPSELLARYEKMRSRLGGIAIARVDHSTCMGCNMKIPAKELEAMRAAPEDEELACEQCGRMLVLP